MMCHLNRFTFATHLSTFFAIFLVATVSLASAVYTNSVLASTLNVLIYHHVDASTPRSTSVTPAEFEQHMAFLDSHGYQVVSLPEAVKTLRKGGQLPPKAVAISFDDAWRSVYTNGLPIMEKYNFPFTVFVNTDFVDGNIGAAMTWDMLRDVQKRGGTLGNHTRDHDYLVRYDDYDQEWLKQVLANVDHAQTRLFEETGITEKWLAYPYGEYNDTLKGALKQNGYVVFGQQSGGIAEFSDWQALPRFSAAGPYSNVEKLKVKLDSLPMPIHYAQLPNPVISNNQSQNPPLLTVKLLRPMPKSFRNRLSCFILGKAYQPTWIDARTWHVQAAAPLPEGRVRYNCTAPVEGTRAYYWLSHQWLIKTSSNQ